MLKGQLPTIIIIVTVVLGLIAYDVFAAITWGQQATLSNIIWVYSGEYRIIPFLFGMLIGHLFTQFAFVSLEK